MGSSEGWRSLIPELKGGHKRNTEREQSSVQYSTYDTKSIPGLADFNLLGLTATISLIITKMKLRILKIKRIECSHDWLDDGGLN